MARVVVGNILDEVLLAPAGGLDRRRLLDSLGAAAGQEEDTAEHGAEDTDRKLLCAACQPLYLSLRASYCSSPRDVQRLAPSRILLMIAPKGSVVRELDVRSESRPCRWRGESSRRPCLRWRVDVI